MLNFGVTGDYDTAPDIGVLCRGVEDGMSELLKLVSDSPPAPSEAAPNGHARPAAPGAGASTHAPGG